MLGLDLHVMPAQVIPLDPREQEALMRLWDREAALSGSALLLDCREMDTSDAARESAITRLIEGTRGALIVAGRERRSSPHRPLITLEVGQAIARIGTQVVRIATPKPRERLEPNHREAILKRCHMLYYRPSWEVKEAQRRRGQRGVWSFGASARLGPEHTEEATAYDRIP